MSFRSRRRTISQLKPRRKRSMPSLEFMEERLLLAVNPIVAENQLPGTPASVWSVAGAGDSTLQGFSTDISVNHGSTISFKINDQAKVPYHIDIYRLGYYQGNGARLVTSIPASQTLDQLQPAPLTDPTTGLVDAGNWAVSASWAVPATATSGLYFARLTRNDTGGASLIYFVVRADESHSALLFQTSDSTWEAYNTWGGSSLYQYGSYASGGGVAVSYNRPLTIDASTGGYGDYNSPMHGEYPMIRFLEQNGYDISYFTDVDSARYGSLILNHQVFLSVGHDEYWSAEQRNNVAAARDAGVNLAFFSGNESFWKTRWLSSIDSSHTNYRTLVTYKESTNGPIDPSGTWTGTWRDSRYSPPQDGGLPENALSGTMYMNDRTTNDLGIPLNVPYSDANLRFWRNTAVATLQPGQVATLGQYVVGYEVNEDVDNGFRPAGLIDMSSTTYSTQNHILVPWGNVVGAGTSTHSTTLYRAASGALVFSAGSIQWSWGLDGNHNDTPSTPDPSMQQATINILADMYVQPATIMAGMVLASPSTDFTAPTSKITAPVSGAPLTAGVPVTINGTASDSGGGVVAGVEVSTDGGQTWHPATGRTSWSYTWVPVAPGSVVIETRAVDDSVNLETPSDARTVNVSYAATSTTGLVASYNFNQGSGSSLADQSGKGNNGTISNAAWSTQGHTGGALSFNGTNSIVSIPGSSSLNLTTGMTLEAWVNPADVTDPSPVIFKEGSGTSPYSLYSTDNIGFNQTVPTAYVSINGGTVPQPYSMQNMTPNMWTFVAATFNGNALTLYINGQPVSSTTATSNSLVTSTGSLDIGGDTLYQEYFQGLIDDVRVYGRALNQAEILADMSTPVGGTLDAVPPTASLSAPANQATVSGTTSVTAAVSDNVGIAGVQFLLNGAPLGNAIFNGPFTLPWNTLRYANGSYTLSARVWDAAGNVATTGSETVTVNNPPSSVLPTVNVTNPLNNASVGNLVALSAVAADPTGVTSVQFQVNGTNYGSPLTSAPYRIGWNTSGLAPGTYTITAVATDLWGNQSTSSPVNVSLNDTTPIVTEQSPAAGASGVPATSPVSVTFSEPVQQSTVIIAVTGPSGNVAGSLVYSSATNTATFYPTSALALSTTYSVSVSGATDTNGGVMSPVSWMFTTTSSLSGATLWPLSSTPVNATTNDPNPVELGVKFTSDTAGYITGIDFYKGSLNTGTHVGHLWSSTGTLLATATFTNETATGWQQVNFSSPVAIAANTTYVASYFAPNGGYADDTGYFTTSLDNAPLHAPSDSSAGGNGVYVYGSSGGFPSTPYNASNYWVTPVFASTLSNPSGVSIVSTSPAANASSVALSSTVTATFNTSVVPGSIVFTLTGPGGSVPATLAYDNTTHTATLTPSAPLAAGASYTAQVSGATDSTGDVMNPTSWSFTTLVNVTNATLWPSTATPAFAAVSDGLPIEVGVKFTSDSAGVITGLRFYKGTTNTGTHVAHLWTASGTLLATATFSGESASGWQQVNFATPVAIAASTTYIASYFSPSGYFAITSGYFSSTGQDSAPLHAPSSPASGGNGVYTYGSNGGFPATTTNASNYWVDVVFSTTVSNPTVPTVVSTSPTAGATGVATSAAVSATFNEAVLQSTISFTLTGPSGAVPATLTYNATTNTATITPSAPLAAGTLYTASISGASDSGGNVMSSVSWTFTTASATKVVTASLPADFNGGTFTGTAISDPTAGGIKLASNLRDDFNGSSLSSIWTRTAWKSSASVSLASGIVTVSASQLIGKSLVGSDTGVEGSVSFSNANQYFGMSTDFGSAAGNSWAAFSTMSTSNTLYARVDVNGATKDVRIGGLPKGFHTYKILAVSGGFAFYVDGTLKTTIQAALPTGVTLNLALSDANGSSKAPLKADWVRVVGGTYASSVYDAGQTATWLSASWSATLPTGTSVIVQTSTSTDGVNWSAWSGVTNGGSVASPSGRYFKYRILLLSPDSIVTPVLSSISFTWS